MIILDTSFVNSLFEEEDSNHNSASELFFGLDEDERIKIPLVVASELAVHEDSVKMVFAAKKITNKFLVNSEDDIDFIKELPFATRRKLKANDCMILALCVRKKAELYTFDKRLKQTLLDL